MRWSLVIVVLVAGVVPSAGSARAGRGLAVVKGRDGDPDLVLDRGRPLRKPSTGRPLSRIERARFEARRRAAATVGAVKLASRLMSLTRTHLPISDAALARHLQLSLAEIRAGHSARLSTRVELGIGACRERCFLLRELLREARLPAEVHYGQQYEKIAGAATDRGGHAWVVARLAGERWLLDPSWYSRPLRLHTRLVAEQDPSGTTHTLSATETGKFFYVPDSSLEIRLDDGGASARGGSATGVAADGDRAGR